MVWYNTYRIRMKIDFSSLEVFEWDKGNLEHIKKHNVDYRECEEIFVNLPLRLNKDEKHSKIEKRLQALGKTTNQRLLFVAFIIRKNRIRIVSARDQNKKERKEFQKIGGDKL